MCRPAPGPCHHATVSEAALPAPLSGSRRALSQIHDVALLDLDGVVYIGPDAVPGVPAALDSARAAGMQLAFVTNNAARPPDVVAEHLTRLGIAARPDEVINSAQAAARYLSERLPTGAHVLVLGTVGLEVALRERALVPVARDDDDVAAVVQGYSPEMNWALLAEGSVAIRRGVPWIATNVDPTVPSPRGPLPGNGSLVAALKLATNSDPVVTGKPDPTMHRETLIRTGASTPIVVGDRLDTDIEGANAVGCPSLLVFSGVSTVQDLLAAPVALRPTHLGADAGALLNVHPAVDLADGAAICGAWRVSTTGAGVELARLDTAGRKTAGTGYDDDTLDAVRALCAAVWAAGSGSPGAVRAADDDARTVLAAIGLHDA